MASERHAPDQLALCGALTVHFEAVIPTDIGSRRLAEAAAGKGVKPLV